MLKDIDNPYEAIIRRYDASKCYPVHSDSFKGYISLEDFYLLSDSLTLQVAID